MAEAANSKGNDFYKEGKYLKAKKCFHEATTLDPEEPKYASNLSAVLYELGRYPAAIKAIQLAWQRLRAKYVFNDRPSTPPQVDMLALKLATRFAKAQVSGVANKTISLHARAEQTDAATNLDNDMEKFSLFQGKEQDPKVREMTAAWGLWRRLRADCAKHSAEECKLAAGDADRRLRALPIFKAPIEPVLEYFRFGHDPVQSLLNGLYNSTTDNYRLDTPQNADKTDWSFVFGGSGDCRHVFGTLIHLADFARRQGKSKNVNVHMTLLDIHPATLARLAIMLSILQQIIEARKKNNVTKVVELHATIFYLFTTMLMPDYCRQILIDTAKSLVQELPSDSGKIPSFLSVNQNSLSAILEVLQYWCSPLPKSTKTFVERVSGVGGLLSSMGLNPDKLGVGNDKLEGLGDSLASLSKLFGDSSPFGAKPKGRVVDAYIDDMAESDIYDRLRILLPPKSLLSRSPALAQLSKSSTGASDRVFTATTHEIEELWHPNPTLFDLISTGHPGLGDESGYPNINGTPFSSINSFAKFSKSFRRGAPPAFCSGKTGFATMAQFFDLVVDAIERLQDSLKIEIIKDDVFTGVQKLVSGELKQRPKEYPTTYTRMFLSNVPDYTNGVLTTAVHLTPHVQTGGHAMANCLLNTPSFHQIADFCYNYSLLTPDELPRVLGCQIINPNNNCFDDIVLEKLPLPQPLDKLASKKELHTYLTHLLLCILCSAKPNMPPARVDMPNNLNAFFHVLVHLHRVGFPSHWIGDFMQFVVSDTLVTDIKPYQGILPIPRTEIKNRFLSAPRKVHLNPWKVELQTAFALLNAMLPFAIARPSDYPTLNDIATYNAKVVPIDLERHKDVYSWGPLVSPLIKAVGLMFYRPHKRFKPDALARRVLGLLEGDQDVEMQIILGAEVVDMRKGEVSWKMSTVWYEKMKSEQWVMAAYRTDLHFAVCEPLGADKWTQVLFV
ncbi:hypothetical protein BDN70DRAFT_877325 [Pholiota conissans]|uniref:DUF4470 domain-containing protein n=1 Tax=Pholiota conissans TaxID=109636 RepID=A0A9P5Z3V7_9AGAR|nr:hypothetical protein BDN70DRAFT_877325 [Pholiota conissans]